jgi:hypothetical protein
LSQSLKLEDDEANINAEYTADYNDKDLSEDEKEAEMFKTYMKKKRKIN